MDWKDTVMSPKQVQKALQYKLDVTQEMCSQCIEHLLKAQAKITWDARESEIEAARNQHLEPPEDKIEAIAEWLEDYCPKHNTTESGWVIIPEIAKEQYREDARELLGLMPPMSREKVTRRE